MKHLSPYYLGTCLEGQIKPIKKPSQVRRCPSVYSDGAPPDHKSLGKLVTQWTQCASV
jgi:hypothetical protein